MPEWEDDARAFEESSPRCDGCGKFISYADLHTGRAVRDFTPDSPFGPERTEFICAKCNVPTPTERELPDPEDEDPTPSRRNTP